MNSPAEEPPVASRTTRRNFQSYRGTWAWLLQRISAILLFLLIPLKIYTGWGIRGKVPYVFPGSPRALHLDAALDILLLFFFLMHAFYGLRVILMDIGLIHEETFFWRTLALAFSIFALVIWAVYLR